MTGPAARLDVRPYACPLTWVKTRIALDRLAPGDVLEVWLLGGEPAESVPRTAEEEGHRVLALEPLPAGGADAFRLLIERRAPPTEPGLT